MSDRIYQIEYLGIDDPNAHFFEEKKKIEMKWNIMLIKNGAYTHVTETTNKYRHYIRGCVQPFFELK